MVLLRKESSSPDWISISQLSLRLMSFNKGSYPLFCSLSSNDRRTGDMFHYCCQIGIIIVDMPLNFYQEHIFLNEKSVSLRQRSGDSVVTLTCRLLYFGTKLSLKKIKINFCDCKYLPFFHSCYTNGRQSM